MMGMGGEGGKVESLMSRSFPQSNFSLLLL